jgi:hypothetical protein
LCRLMGVSFACSSYQIIHSFIRKRLWPKFISGFPNLAISLLPIIIIPVWI